MESLRHCRRVDVNPDPSLQSRWSRSGSFRAMHPLKEVLMNTQFGKPHFARLSLFAIVASLCLIPGAAQAQTGNTATGADALHSNTTGSYNTADGYTALYTNTTGSYNTANGLRALYFNTIGNYNVASGDYALNYNTSGSDNVANGAYALYDNTTGGYNAANG